MADATPQIFALLYFDGNEDNTDLANIFGIAEMVLPCTNSGISMTNMGRKAGPLTIVFEINSDDNTVLLDWWLQNNTASPAIVFWNSKSTMEVKRKIQLTEATCLSYVETYGTGKYEGRLVATAIIEADSVTVVGTEVSNA